jgi:hypothetical protein
MVIGSFFGLMGLAWSQVVFGVIAAQINMAPAGKTLNYGTRAQLSDLVGIFAVGALMSGALLFARSRLPPMHPELALITLVSLGAAIYVGMGFAFRLRIFSELSKILLSLLDKRRKAQLASGDKVEL